MSTLGAFPIDPSTPVGLFRFEVGDVTGVPNVPDDGQAVFEFLSDDTITALLAAYASAGMAKSRALMSMASQLISSAQDIQVDDIRIRTVERARLMLELANGFAASADAFDASSGFQIVPLISSSGYYGAPQGTPEPYGAFRDSGL